MALVAWEKESLALAKPGCRSCDASGMVGVTRIVDADGVVVENAGNPCNCVCRKIFGACYYKYRAISEGSRHDSPVVTSNHFGASRPYEEYVADFVLVSRRALEKYGDAWVQLFNYHFLFLQPLERCAIKIGKHIDEVRGMVVDIQIHLGRVYRELQPHALFPLYEYFARAIPAPLRRVV